MKITEAKPSKLSKRSISLIGEIFSRKTGYIEDKNIIQTIGKMGGTIEVKDFWDKKEKSGSLEVSNIKKFKIFVPRHTSLERDRFTIAHELGHYVIHYLFASDGVRAGRFVADRYGSGRVEWEANWFAASFLMPEKEFKKSFSKYMGNTYRVSEVFRVSEQAARIRAKSLGLI